MDIFKTIDIPCSSSNPGIKSVDSHPTEDTWVAFAAEDRENHTAGVYDVETDSYVAQIAESGGEDFNEGGQEVVFSSDGNRMFFWDEVDRDSDTRNVVIVDTSDWSVEERIDVSTIDGEDAFAPDHSSAFEDVFVFGRGVGSSDGEFLYIFEHDGTSWSASRHEHPDGEDYGGHTFTKDGDEFLVASREFDDVDFVENPVIRILDPNDGFSLIDQIQISDDVNVSSDSPQNVTVDDENEQVAIAHEDEKENAAVILYDYGPGGNWTFKDMVLRPEQDQYAYVEFGSRVGEANQLLATDTRDDIDGYLTKDIMSYEDTAPFDPGTGSLHSLEVSPAGTYGFLAYDDDEITVLSTMDLDLYGGSAPEGADIIAVDRDNNRVYDTVADSTDEWEMTLNTKWEWHFAAEHPNEDQNTESKPHID